jgi:hypothetical protein
MVINLPGKEFQRYKRSQDIIYEIPYHASIYSNCPGLDSDRSSYMYKYEWHISQNEIIKPEFISQSKFPSRFYLPGYTLSADSIYKLSLVVYNENLATSSSAYTTIVIEKEDVISSINGGEFRYIKPFHYQLVDQTRFE